MNTSPYLVAPNLFYFLYYYMLFYGETEQFPK